MELWFTERQTPDVGITCKASHTLHSEKSEFQDIAVIETAQFGRMLVLDGLVQTTIKDEFVYHEMITHIPLFTHPSPKKVLVIGGGDGGTVREILKHPSVEQIDLVEIDGRVVELSKQYFPELSCQLSNPKTNVLIKDGIKHVNDAANKNTYDVIIVDSSDPVGPGVDLFRSEFYQAIFNCLKEDGIFVAQTESPFYHAELIKDVNHSIKEIFPVCFLYLASIPTYPSGFWSFTLGSKKHHPLQVNTEKLPEIDTKYYSPNIHKATFALPKFVEDMVR